MDSIVLAAAELFSSLGFEATTTDAIAARAGTSVGSLYQFFPTKLALFRAVAERALANSATLFQALGERAGQGHWREHVADTIDAFFTAQSSDPCFRAALANPQLYGEFAAADAALARQIVLATAELLSGWTTSLGREHRHAIASVLVHAIEGLLLQASREPPVIAVAIAREAKTMLIRYLEPYVEAPEPARAPGAPPDPVRGGRTSPRRRGA